MRKFALNAMALAVSGLISAPALPQDTNFSGGTDTWQKIANNGSSFVLPGNSLVRYGRPGRWTNVLVTGTSGMCTMAALGVVKDPAPGLSKQCDRRNGAVLAIDSSGGATTHLFGLDVSEASIAAANATLAVTLPGVGYSTLDPSPTHAAPTAPRSAGFTVFTGDVNGSTNNPGLDEGALRTQCNVTHISHEDAIVHPGQPDSTHSHTFFGNTAIDSYTTGNNIRTRKNPKSSCIGGTVNLSAYWVPSMMRPADHSVVIPPRPVLVYYKTGDWPYLGTQNPAMENLPNGFRVVSGDATRTTYDSISSFSCNDSMGNSKNAALGITDSTNLTGVAACNVPGYLLWHFLAFHQCWDGNLDSANHRSHLVNHYDTGGGGTRTMLCPNDHPYVLLKISEIVKYAVSSTDNPGTWALSSDFYLNTPGNSVPPGMSAHADYMFGWDKTISDQFIQLCEREGRNCGSWDLGNGRGAAPFQGNDNNS